MEATKHVDATLWHRRGCPSAGLSPTDIVTDPVSGELVSSRIERFEQ
jgi:hypothetical protein